MKLRAEVFVPKDLVVDVKRMTRAVENALDGAALAVKVDFDTTTRTWRNRSVFLIRRPKVFVREIYTTDIKYSWVSEGTRAHVIRAKNVPRLGFHATGFRPKTRKGYIGSNKGRSADKDFVAPTTVQHPGTEPRELVEAIKEKWDKKLPETLQRAIDAEAR